MDALKTIWDPSRMAAARRAFLKASGFATAGAAALGVNALTAAPAEAAVTDADIFNFALNLEYLEAEYYLRAIGQTLAASEISGATPAGAVTGGAAVPFTSATVRGYATEIANDERQHVRFIRQVLGSAAVARPKIDLRNSFTAAARAAGVIGAGQTFNPFAGDTEFLIGAFIFEDVGVTAYKGAARLIANKDYLEAAAGILAVEAYHAGEVRTLLFGRGVFDVTQKISNLRGAASGNAATDQGIGSANKPNIVPALPGSGIVPSRTTTQVLSIVYLGGDGQGGFFPEGLNGTIA